ncbi:MAG: CDP-glucose 4,6-dehydratase [Nanoarchaeota archaeon]|nr:CDP-glucose 4,6-dehydratase [Nanoarchaeota archaeon]
MNKSFWKDKRVLITGHTGFKGTWLTIWLHKLGAKVIGYSLEEYPNDIFFNESKISKEIIDVRGDVTDFHNLKGTFEKHAPEIVFHLAAQPLVRKSFDEPVDTLKTNIIGSTNVLECIRLTDSVKGGVIITSDKCYKNVEQVYGYKEIDVMGGYDLYSCSKGCVELIVDAYRNSFFKKQKKFVASARAGNVIGGGDWSEDRLIPDCIKALTKNIPIKIRNPKHTRPWQHVLEPLSGYMVLAEKMIEEEKYDEAWNFGPNLQSIKPVGEIVSSLVNRWGNGEWVDCSRPDDKHEAALLSLDISKAYFILDWKPKMDIRKTLSYTIDWYKRAEKENVYDLCIQQIQEYDLELGI